MTSRVDCSVVVLTLDEEANIGRLLESLEGWAAGIFIVDSGSTDRTLEIARRFTERIVFHEFTNQAKQFNWALDNLPITTGWVLRLDADEFLPAELRDEIAGVLPGLPLDVTGLLVKRRVYFLGRWIRHGGMYPIWMLRLVRRGKGRSEQVEMDEHLVVLEGRTQRLRHDFVHDDRKGLAAWTAKHEGYAGREARLLRELAAMPAVDARRGALAEGQRARKRWLKSNLYARSPLFLRAFLYFSYRYLLRLGFLDGREGLAYHVLQGFWYRFYVDAKLWEARRAGRPQAETGRPS